VAELATALPPRIDRPGIGLCGPRRVRWAHTRSFGESPSGFSSATGLPQQIAEWLRLKYPDDEASWVSHETIYRSLFVQARGVLKKALIEHLRTHRPIGRSRHATDKANLRGRIPDTVSISERPASIEDRAVPGHWEGDLPCGSPKSVSATGRSPNALMWPEHRGAHENVLRAETGRFYTADLEGGTTASGQSFRQAIGWSWPIRETYSALDPRGSP
jgi:hypothetical protein